MSVHVVAVVALAVFAGAVVQASVGFGIGTLAGPIAALLDPRLMPEAMLITGAALPLLTLSSEWRHADRRGLGWALLGRLPGMLLGALVVTLLTAQQLGVVIALVVLAAVGITGSRLRIPRSRTSLALGGVISGITGTAAGIGGPPMALIYQRDGGPTIRASLAAFFFVGGSASLCLLALLHEVDTEGILMGVMLLPCVYIGHLAAIPLRRRLRPDLVRVSVLLVAGLSAAALLLRSFAL